MPALKRIAKLRIAFHYQTVLGKLEQSRVETGEHLDPEDDLPNILESQAWCAENAATDDAAAALCSKLGGVAGHWLEQRLNRMEQIRWREAGLAAAERLGDIEDQIAHLTHLSFIHYMNGNTDRAEALCERSLRIGRERGNSMAEATSLHLLGMFQMRSRQLEKARSNLELALSIFRELGELRGEASVIDTLGLTYGYLEQHDKELEILTRAVDLSREGGFRSSEGTSLANRASALSATGRLKEASEDLGRALEIANQLDDDHLRGLALAKLAVLTTRTEESSTRAMELLEEALEAFRHAGDRIHELEILAGMENAMRSFLDRPAENRSHDETSAALRKLTAIHVARHEYSDAYKVYEELLHEAEGADDLPGQLEAWIQLGRCSVLLKEHERAAREHQKALGVLTDLRKTDGSEAYNQPECELWLSLGQAQRHLGRPEEARTSYERARDIAEGMGDVEAKWRAEGNLGLIYTDLGKFDQAIQTLKKTADFYRRSRNYLLEAHGLFNQAYAYHQKGDAEKAWHMGEESRRLLEQMGDPSAEEVRRQMETWPPPKERKESQIQDDTGAKVL